MKFTTLTMAAAAIGLCLAACSNDNVEGADGTIPVDSGDPASFTLAISEPATRAADANATASETTFTSADIFIYADNNLSKHVRLDKDQFTDQGNHVWATTNPIVSTTGLKEVYVGLNMPENLGKAMAAKKNKTALELLCNTDQYPLIDAQDGFVMFSTQPEEVVLEAENDKTVNVNVARIVAKVTVQKGENLTLDLDEGTLSDLTFAIRNSNMLYWPYQKKVNNVVYDPNWTPSEWDEDDFNQAASSEYVGVDEFATVVKDRKVKYTPENTSEKTQQRETTYASVRAKFVPENFTTATGELISNSGGTPQSFWVVKIDETGEAYYFDNYDDADAFATDKGSISDEYKDGYCYYNLFLNPDYNFQTYRNNYYQLRIASISGIGNPNPEDEGDTEKPVTKPANLNFTVNIVEWKVFEYDYDLF